MCLQETKPQQLNSQLMRSWGVCRFLDWGVVEARGFGGFSFFGTAGSLTYLIWKLVFSLFHVDSETAKTVSLGFSQGCTILSK